MNTCVLYQKTKLKHYLFYNQLVLLLVLTQLFEEISLNFITEFFTSTTLEKQKYNAILMIVYRLTKFVLYIFITKYFTTDKFVILLLYYIIKFGKLLAKIISDQRSLFISKFWIMLYYYLAVKQCFSTFYYSQTNKQTKRQNQNFEYYLCIYCFYI